MGEALRAAVMRSGNREGHASLPDSLHHGAGDPSHPHAHWLSEDRDGDGLIDHLLLFTPSGLPQGLWPTLHGAGPVWLDRSWRLEPLGARMGAGRLAGPARRWRAATAYVTPLHRHKREVQLRAEIEKRGLPAPERLVWEHAITVGQVALGPATFVRATQVRRAPAGAQVGAPTLWFEAELPGPLSFGFGTHFGLGLLLPWPH